MSVNTIAVKLGTTSSSDLVMASCAHLAFIQNKDTFHRNDIIREMKTASNYFKSNHIKNLSQSLKSLISSGKLIERSKDTFALSANETSTLKAKLK